MRVNVRGKNIQVTDALHDHVEKKVGKLERFFNNFGDAQVTLTVEKDIHRVEVTIPLNGMILRGEEATHDMYASVDLVVDKLEKQLERFKGKLIRRGTKLNIPGDLEELPPEEPFKIVRTKRFMMKPMPAEEAVMQMNLLGHSFFVFTNADSDEVNVVYKRNDGNYGLIEPEA
ncbi:MAG: ribosome-associated translation inhibitor RaiA [Desulforudis sp.]|jgi:putative sigma-54 modulation protein|nr:ribosome-associated translation inhibitor RaiA [Clostridia bacterium]MDQ7792174.1 ribosome-associated translation inhibitor RaiA [Clostridia bacterium]RJX21772.1 MAG: ribosome-associated translation inhibitor RaiA [Desulforudis sp.]